MTSPRIESLFDTRGGSLQVSVCEVCGDPISDDAVSPVCTDCHTVEEAAS